MTKIKITLERDDTAEIIRNADILVVDCGTMTGKGDELELPKATLPFFRLRTPRQRINTVIDGKRHFALVARRTDNGMTRISLGKHSPTYGEQCRSRHAVRFLRTGNRYRVEFVDLGSAQYTETMRACAIGGLWQSVKHGPKTNRPRCWGCL